jgi:serine/threonine protein kinase/formylglycine-generating enzyme required for sulfatase activity/dienelactone hydrolase
MKPGDTVSHYRILEALGAGGMGIVYKAEDTRLKRLVALKFLPVAIGQDHHAKERLVQEAQAASALDHPNICTIYEINETENGQLFLAMAYYQGETLKQRLARGPMPVEAALDLFTGVVNAVAAAHSAGIIHRDIKPANIMVTGRGDVKLLDFGIAKLQGQTALTRTGTTLGTVAYMAPEQVTGGAIDARADVWSLGVVLFEMLTARTPFAGEHDAAILHAIASKSPVPLSEIRPDVPPAVERIVARAFQKDPAARFASAGELARDLDALRSADSATVAHTTPPPPSIRGRGRWAAAAAVVVAIAAAGLWLTHQALVRRARLNDMPRAEELIRTEQPAEAYRLIRQLEPLLAGDAEFDKVRDGFLLPTTITSTPPGADVYMKGYREVDSDWYHLGRTPIEFRLPRGYFRVRVSKPGFLTFEAARGLGDMAITLSPDGAIPAGMVRVSAGTAQIGNGTEPFEDFFLDKFEVTNSAYKAFVDAGGYRSPQFWQEPFAKAGRTLTFEEAMAEFRDTTGRPGPSTWELGAFSEGQGDMPVHGISWYEAAAYARFAGKVLPTVHHWRRAAALGPYSDILEFSNFSNKGPAIVGTYKGLGEFGTYDMAGNVKEWCWNESNGRRYILGGGWNEPNYLYSSPDTRLPFDRSAGNGVRLMKPVDAASLPAKTLDPILRLVRDYSIEKPVSDDVFRVYAQQFAYDKSALNPTIESTDDSSPFWKVERITYNAAYNRERISAYLYLPKNAKPPYQTVVYFPHSGGFALRRFEQAEMSYLSFLVRAGRALLFPMYKGIYERRIAGFQPGPVAVRDGVIQQVKDLRRSLDYLSTRSDIASERLAYFGVSYGGRLAAVVLAVESRFKTAVLWSGGLSTMPRLPEIDEINFAPRVRTPILMLNGRDDFDFPVEQSQKPMFGLLGTPDADKRYVLFDGGHIFPFNRIQKDTLDWLDERLGVPQ